MIIYYQSQSIIHKIHNNHGCTTTMNLFRRTCKESKITLYYWLYTMIIMQFTGLLSVHFSSFLCFSFLQKPACFTGYENPPNKCGKITRRDPPFPAQNPQARPGPPSLPPPPQQLRQRSRGGGGREPARPTHAS